MGAKIWGGEEKGRQKRGKQCSRAHQVGVTGVGEGAPWLSATRLCGRQDYEFPKRASWLSGDLNRALPVPRPTLDPMLSHVLEYFPSSAISKHSADFKFHFILLTFLSGPNHLLGIYFSTAVLQLFPIPTNSAQKLLTPSRAPLSEETKSGAETKDCTNSWGRRVIDN